MKTKKPLRNLLRTILSILFLILIAWYLIDNRHVFENLKNIKSWHVLVLLILQVLVIAIAAWTNQIMIARLGTRISFMDNFLLQWLNNLFNKIIPNSGAAFRAVYLKRVYSFSFIHFSSTIAALYIVNFAVQAFVGLICLLFLYFQKNIINVPILSLYILFSIFSLVLLFISPSIKKRSNRILQILDDVLEGWKEVKRDPKAILVFVVFVVINQQLITLQNLLVFRSMDISVNFFSVLFLSTFHIISMFVVITPGSIGIKEMIYMFSASVITASSETLLLVSLIMRAIALAAALFFGGISYFILQRKSSDKKISPLKDLDFPAD